MSKSAVRIVIVFHLLLLCSFVFGQVPQWEWANNISTSEHEEINDVVADKSTNDVYVVGEWKLDLSATFPAGINPSTDFSIPFGNTDGLVAKYDSAGNLIWSFKLGGPNNDKAEAISIDPGGNIYITGYFGTGTSYFSGTSPYAPASTLDNPSEDDFFIAKYDSSGAFQWVKRSTTNFGNLRGLDLCATSSAVYACGYFDGWASFGPLDNLSNPNGKDIFLVKYNLDGDEQWITDAGSNGDDIAYGVIADETNAYFTGSFTGTNLGLYHANGGSAATIGNANNGTEEIILSSFNANGSHNWSHSISSLNIDIGWAIAMDSDSLYLTGETSDQASFPGYVGNQVSSSGGRDVFISSHAKSDGNTGWVTTLACSDLDHQRGLSIDTDGNGGLYISGVFKGELYFPNTVFLSSEGDNDAFLTGYSANGEFRWALSAGSARNEGGQGISAGSGGSIYIGGFYDDLFTLGPLTLPDDVKHNGYVSRLKVSVPPVNDYPCSAIYLESGDTCNTRDYNNVDATDSGIPDPGCGTYAGSDVWFKTVIPASGNLFVGTNTSEDDTYPPTNGWLYRVEMAIYSGACSSLNLEGCYSHTSGYNFRTSSAFLFDKNPGDTIWIRVWEAFGNDFGDFSICTFDPGQYPAWSIPEELCADAGIIDLDSTLAEMQFGFVDNVVGSSGVQDIGFVTGAPDGSASKLLETGDWMKLDLTDTIPAGEILIIYFRSNFLFSPPTAMTINVSQDDITYYPHSFKPETDMDVLTPHYIITELPTRYLYIENDNAGGGGFVVDGIKYFYRGTRGGIWSGPGVSGSLFDPSGLSGPVSITYSVGGTTTRTDSIRSVIIRNSDGGLLSPDTSVCADAHSITMELKNYNGEIIQWESSIDGFNSTAPIGVTEESYTVADLSQTTEFRVIVQEGSCSTDTSNTVLIEVLENPGANAGSGSIVCGLSAGLQAIPSIGTGTWSVISGPGTAIFTPNENDPIVSVNVDNYGSYEILWTELNGVCFDTDTITMEFLKIPESDPGSAEHVCGDSTGLHAIPSADSGLWSKKSGPGEAIYKPSPNDPDAVVKVDQYGTYQFTWTETNGTCSDDSTLSVTFYEPPVINPGLGGDTCSLSFGLNAIASVGKGKWSKTTGPGSVYFTPSDTIPDPTVSVSLAGSYNFTWMEENGPCSSGATIIVDFLEPPPVDPGPGGVVCGLEFDLNAVPSFGSGIWTLRAGPGTATFNPSENNPNATVNVSAFGNYEFLWTESDGDCSNEGSVMVNFTEFIIVDAGPGGAVCGQHYNLSALETSGLGHWNKISGPGQVSFSPSDSVTSCIVFVDEFGDYIFQWEVIQGNCSGSDTVAVSFYRQPESHAGPDQELEFVFTTFLNAEIPEFGLGTWALVQGRGEIADFNDPASSVNDLGLGINEFSWTVSSTGCNDATDNVMITVKDIQTSTVITPNNDGMNDFLVFPGLEYLSGCELLIFNRWGTEVFRNEDYKNDWDGRDHKSRELIQDTYYYILKIPPERIIKGFIEIRR